MADSNPSKKKISACIEEGLTSLTNELLRAFSISHIIFLFIKIIYFLMRAIESYHWDFSFFVFVSVILNLISLDQLFRINPHIFDPILYTTLIVLIAIIVFSVIVAMTCGWGKKTPYVVRTFIKIICIFCYLLKTVLIIPLMNIALIATVPSIALELNIAGVPMVRVIIGIFLLVMLVIIETYVLVFFREPSPFSQLPHAGQTLVKQVIWIGIKTGLTLYGLLDLQGNIELPATLIITVTSILTIIYSHLEVGLYKSTSSRVQLHLLYLVFTVGILHSSDFSGGEITTVAYLAPLNFLTYFVCAWIRQRSNKYILNIRFREIETFQQLQKQIICLIDIIQNYSVRQNKLVLEGFLSLHKRDCQVGQLCPCQGIDFREQQQGYEQIAKVEYFKLMVVLINSFKERFPHENKIDLFMGLINHFKLKNSVQANYCMRRMVRADGSDMLDRIYRQYYLQIIEQEMVEVDKAADKRSADVNRYYDYTNAEEGFQLLLEESAKKHIQFWNILLDKNPDIRSIDEVGTKVSKSKQEVKKSFENINSVNSKNAHLLTIYSKFLIQVTNEQTSNVKYAEQAKIILKELKNSDPESDLTAKYQLGTKTAYVAVSGDEDKPGIVVHTNNKAKEYLGFSRSQVLGKNVKAIMPKLFAEMHDHNFKKYVRSPKGRTNGVQLVVPGLHKNGHIVPITALIKMMPSLIDGIRIVTFIAKYDQHLQQEEYSKVNYLLYRCDTQQVCGVTQGMFKDYGIEPCLIDGNPLNQNQKLELQHLFGVKFQKEGGMAQAIEVSEVNIMLKTTHLKNIFYLNRGNVKTELMVFTEQEEQKGGVEKMVWIKNKLFLTYYGVPIKLIGVYEKNDLFKKRQKKLSLIRQPQLRTKKTRSRGFDARDNQIEEQQKKQNEDSGHLKDFKYFISRKSQPRAIVTMNYICVIFLLVFTGAIIGLIVNYLYVLTLNQNVLRLHKYTLETQLVTSEVLTQIDMNVMLLTYWNITGLPATALTQAKINRIVMFGKDQQYKVLPLKYFFDSQYNYSVTDYRLNPTGDITSQQDLMEAAISNYLTIYQMLMSSNTTAVIATPLQRFQSNIFLKYRQLHINQPYTIRNALNYSNQVNTRLHKEGITQRKAFIIGVNVALMGAIILLTVLLLPYVLSVTKINNRVLSLFTLIPNPQIYKLIYDCLKYMNQHLAQANVDHQDLNFYQGEQSRQPRQIQQSNLGSPSQMNSMISADFSHGYMRKGYQAGNEDSIVDVEQKFDKMVNSEDGKKGIILKYVLISFIFLVFLLFYLLYSLNLVATTSDNIYNYKMIGRRAALIRHSRLLLTEYSMNPLYHPLGMQSLRTVTQDFIQEYYNLQADLLTLSLQEDNTKFAEYNTGNLCAYISSYKSFSIFNQSLTAAQCSSVRAGILQKGIKTAVINCLEDMRATLAQYPTAVPQSLIASKTMQTEIMTKYIETPMLEVQGAVWGTIMDNMQNSRLTIILAGSLFMGVVLGCWRLIWTPYLQELNSKIWRTKGLLNLIPMRIVKTNQMLKNQFISGKLQNAIK